MGRRYLLAAAIKAALMLAYFAALVALGAAPYLVVLGLGRAGVIADASAWRTPSLMLGTLLAVLAVMTVGRVAADSDRSLRRLRRWGSKRLWTPSDRLGLHVAARQGVGSHWGDGLRLVAPAVQAPPFDVEGVPRAVLGLRAPGGDHPLALVAYRVAQPIAHDPDDTHDVDFTVLLLSGLGDLPVAVFAPRRRADAVAGAAGRPELAVESAAFNAAWRVVATDARAAHAMLTPLAIEALLEPAARRLRFATAPGMAWVTWDGFTVPGNSLDAAAALLDRWAAALPGFLARGDVRGGGQ